MWVFDFGSPQAIVVAGCYGNGRRRFAVPVSKVISKKQRKKMIAQGVDDNATLRGNFDHKKYPRHKAQVEQLMMTFFLYHR